MVLKKFCNSFSFAQFHFDFYKIKNVLNANGHKNKISCLAFIRFFILQILKWICAKLHGLQNFLSTMDSTISA